MLPIGMPGLAWPVHTATGSTAGQCLVSTDFVDRSFSRLTRDKDTHRQCPACYSIRGRGVEDQLAQQRASLCQEHLSLILSWGRKGEECASNVRRKTSLQHHQQHNPRTGPAPCMAFDGRGWEAPSWETPGNSEPRSGFRAALGLSMLRISLVFAVLQHQLEWGCLLISPVRESNPRTQQGLSCWPDTDLCCRAGPGHRDEVTFSAHLPLAPLALVYHSGPVLHSPLAFPN